MSIKSAKIAAKNEAIATMKKWLDDAPKDHNGKPIIYTALRSVAPSGMSRIIAVFIIGSYSDNTTRIIDASRVAALIMDTKEKRTPCGYGLGVSGCSMDMGYHVAHTIACAVCNDGYAVSHSWL
jgi:hypothetical protein